MKIYGAGSVEDVKICTEMGAVGILTNPQGFEQYFKGEMTLEEITKALLEVSADLPVFIQVHGKTSADIIAKARDLHKLSPRVGFKIISNPKGFEAIRQLQKEGIDCIATCLFSISQAAIAASVNAFGICPFVSRAAAIGIDPFEMLASIQEAYSRIDNAPEVIAVSMKSVADIDMALKAGVDAVGMRWPAIQDMMTHTLSDKAELLFSRNWKKVKGEDVSYMSHAFAMEGLAE
jgi:transaldolase